MNPIDFLIIYLSCGAPFGVYYFFQNRTRIKSNRLWFKSFLNFLFWLPFAVRLLRRNKNSRTLSLFGADKSLPAITEQETKLHSSVKQIERIFTTGKPEISIYEFREIIERYTGLTIANQTGAAQNSDAEIELYQILQTKNIELAAMCLNRRNRKRLILHQTEARKDFLHLISQLLESNSDGKKLEQSAIELVIILKDFEARKKLEKMFASPLQTGNRFSVPETEKDLWKPETPKPSPAKQIAYRLPIMKATLDLRKKD